MFKRLINLPKSQSFFLFGPRGVGKSTLLKTILPTENTYTLDLLDIETETRLLRRPQELKEIMTSLPHGAKWVFIDEIQKAPKLLNEIHRQIELNPDRHFAMTGSSARKLIRGQANLLAGRALTYHLAPLTSLELGDNFRLEEALAYGTLPKIFSLTQEDRNTFLKTYAYTYLKEEIQAEGLVRSLPNFSRFVAVAGLESGNVLSWSHLAQDVGVDAKTIKAYFQIMENTWLGFFLPAYQRSIRQRQKTHPKFYLFDPGVKRALINQLNLPLLPGTSEYGRAFEHFWLLEIMHLSQYRQLDYTFSYFATHNLEIDLVIERPGQPTLFIEFKSTDNVKDVELRALRSIVQDVKNCQGLCVCREPRKRKFADILICPWQEILTEIGLR